MNVYTATELPDDAILWGHWSHDDAPVHVSTGGGWGQAWCGARPQTRHTAKPTDTPVTCRTCLRRLAIGRPQARGTR